MNTLLTSDFIARLGWTLLHSLWQIALVGLVMALSRLIWRSPNARHSAAMLALVASVAWPVVSFVRPATQPTFTPLISPVESEPPEIQLPTNAPKVAPMIERTTSQKIVTKATTLHRQMPSLMSWVAMLWITGVFLLTLRQAGALYALHLLRTRGLDEVPPAIRALFEQTKARLGVHRLVKLVASTRVIAPVVIGSLRPVVLLPTSLIIGLPTDQIEALLAHELAHLRRWDDVANLLQCAIETLLFYHPVVWWMSRRAREDRELCCDDLATANGVERTSLAQALGRLVLWQTEATQPALAATGHMPVLARIQRLLQPTPASVSVNSWPIVVVLAVTLIATMMSKANAELPPRGRILDRNGVVLAESPKPGERRYPLKTVAPHIIGYTGLTSPKRDTISGRAGIEESMEKELSAKQDVTLTIDSKVQQLSEEILAQRARNGGAVVIIDVTTGDLVAMASNPGYDLNEFVPRVRKEAYDRFIKDRRKPILGRAFQSTYYPASSAKFVTALACLKSGAITEATLFDSPASFQIGNRAFRNWNKEGEGDMNVVGALKRSSNTWFYQAALKAGAKPVTDMLGDMGFGKATGLPIRGEAKGFLPTDEYYQQRDGTKILPGMLASIAIGQVVTGTPLQVVIASAAIANGGKVLRPRLLKTDAEPQFVNDLIANGLRVEDLDSVKKGMIAVVNGEGGTGHNAQVPGLTVAGNTGTAQVHVDEDSSKNTWLAWFVGFAPVEKPKYAFAVVYEGAPGEHVSGGSIAAPIAREILVKMKEMSLFTGQALDAPPVKKADEKKSSSSSGFSPRPTATENDKGLAGEVAALRSGDLGKVFPSYQVHTLLMEDGKTRSFTEAKLTPPTEDYLDLSPKFEPYYESKRDPTRSLSLPFVDKWLLDSAAPDLRPLDVLNGTATSFEYRDVGPKPSLLLSEHFRFACDSFPRPFPLQLFERLETKDSVHRARTGIRVEFGVPSSPEKFEETPTSPKNQPGDADLFDIMRQRGVIPNQG